MKWHRKKYALSALMIMLICAGRAQTTSTHVWKKQIARVITLKENTAPNKTRLSQKSAHDSTLLEMIVTAGIDAKVTLYSNVDHQFTTKLSEKYLKYQFYPPPDTTDVIDPITQKEFRRIRPAHFDFNEIAKFRFLEEWTFDQSNGETSVHIAGVAPLQDIYLADGSTSVQAVFWAHYADIAPIIARYERKNTANSLTQKWWEDHFGSEKNIENAAAGTTQPETKIYRQYDLDPEDTGNGHLKNMEEDTSLYDRLYNAITLGKLAAYDSTGYRLSQRALQGIPDTTTVIDPINGDEMQKVVPHPFLFGHKPLYRIIEEWSFSKATGDITVRTAALAPFLTGTDPFTGSTDNWDIFWLKYTDAYEVLNQYELTHPGMSLELSLWRDRLYTGKK